MTARLIIWLCGRTFSKWKYFNISVKNSPKMADSDFLFDAVIGFLISPIWTTPVPSFIEQNCVVFDPDADCHDSYKEIHEQYKQMVEMLLSCFIKDIGITAEQFTAACKEKGGNSQFKEIRRNVLEQVWAAEDFEVFKRLMIQKNIELQLQALQLIRKSQPTAPPLNQVETNEEDEIMKEVLRLSKEEYDRQSSQEKKEEEDLKKTLTESFEEHESQSITKALEEAEDAFERRLKMLAEREQGELQKALKTCTISQEPNKTHEIPLKTADTVVPTPTTLPKVAAAPVSTSADKTKVKEEPKPQKASPQKDTAKPQEKPQETKQLPSLVGVEKSKSSSDAAASWMSSAKAEAAAASSAGTKPQNASMTEDEIKQRTEYLKAQRDKLLQMKKDQREKNLIKYTDEQPIAKARPMSARAARRATSGEPSTSAPTSVSPTDDKKLAMRRALADVLKREVIEKH